MPSTAYLTGSGPLGHALLGSIPSPMYGEGALDGDGWRFSQAPIGTEYYRKVDSNHVQKYVKAHDTNTDRDWVLVNGVISQTLTLADFTDNENTTGEVELVSTIPAGALVERTFAYVTVAFDATTTAVMTVGDGSTVDRYNTGTPSVAATGPVDMGVVSGTAFHATAVSTITVTITEDDDFTDITEGTVTVTIHYRM